MKHCPKCSGNFLKNIVLISKTAVLQGVISMMKGWATVVSWQHGVAILRYDRKNGCGICNSCSNYDTVTLNGLVSESDYLLQVYIDQPLEPGQLVEVGVAERIFLRCAMLLYLVPLMGVMLSGSLLQYWLHNDVFTAFGALLGGALSLMLIRILCHRLSTLNKYQLTIL